MSIKIELGACTNCGDSLQTVETVVPDHHFDRKAWLGWCMDCKAFRVVYLGILDEEDANGFVVNSPSIPIRYRQIAIFEAPE